eukprot:2399044-Pyramimonas_sp.AAC.1
MGTVGQGSGPRDPDARERYNLGPGGPADPALETSPRTPKTFKGVPIVRPFKLQLNPLWGPAAAWETTPVGPIQAREKLQHDTVVEQKLFGRYVGGGEPGLTVPEPSLRVKPRPQLGQPIGLLVADMVAPTRAERLGHPPRSMSLHPHD